MNLAQMANLFEIDIDSSLEATDESSDYGSSGEKAVRSFDECCNDIKTTMKPDDAESLVKALKIEKKSAEVTPARITDKAAVEIKSPKSEPAFEDLIETEEEIPGDITPVKEDVAPPVSAPADISNPLELTGDNLRIYNEIAQKYQQFMLYNGSRAYRDFYLHKFNCLKTALRRFRLLDLHSMMDELRDVKIDHYVDADIIHPDLIRIKLNEAYKSRVRVAFLLIEAFEQFYAWKRWLDMMKSKLWKDHGQKGAHNRDGLTVEHLYDIEQYVNDMEGFIEASKHIDNMLKAASESLSRQLTCLQLKEQHGLNKTDTPTSTSKQESIGLGSDDLDTIESGAVISAPKSSGTLHSIDFGTTETDEFARL